MTCDCERGGPCNKVTVCRMESAVEEVREEAEGVIERLQSRLAEAERLLREVRSKVSLADLMRLGLDDPIAIFLASLEDKL